VKWITITKLAVSFAATFSVAAAGSIFTTDEAISVWYAGLNKPFFNPPGWLFGPVWTVLYALMATAAFLVWQKGFDNPAVRVGLGLFAIQLVLNAAWTPIFFGLKMPLLAFVEILMLLFAILLTTAAFTKVSIVASLLLVPYVLWTSFAAVLNATIWLMNR